MPEENLAAVGCIHSLYARELTHRTANTLQNVIAAVHISRRGDRAHLDQAMSRLNGAADLHRVLDYARPSLIDVAEAIEEACAAALRAAGAAENVLLHVAADPLLADARIVRPLLMVAAELVGNSVRHAFAEGRGSILALVRDDGETTTIVVEDDGRCFGWDRPGGEGRGIVDDLARSRGGSVKRSVTPGGSSRVEVVVPSIAAAASAPAGSV